MCADFNDVKSAHKFREITLKGGANTGATLTKFAIFEQCVVMCRKRWKIGTYTVTHKN